MEITQLKARHDLRYLVEQDLGPAPLHSGRAWLWKCPFHRERKGYSLAVWADGYRCFGRCDVSGDVLDWLREYRNLSFVDALRVLGQPVDTSGSLETRPPRSNVEPPLWKWQQSAAEIVALAEENLWSAVGEDALSYLIERGLRTDTIRKARLGYIPGDYREQKTLAGLEVPCGITIPWFTFDALWAVKVRRNYGIPKYLQIAGGNRNGLYGADCLPNKEVVIFCEGEFDALLTHQETGDHITAVTLGSAVNRLLPRWFPELAACPTILVAYDNDEAGRSGAKHLMHISPRFHTITVPAGKDITDFYLQGGDIGNWIEWALTEKPWTKEWMIHAL